MNIDKSIKKIIGNKNNVFNNLMGDRDKDGVRNILDCKPRNRFKQGPLDKPQQKYFIEQNGLSYIFRPRQYYQDVAEQARMNVKVLYGNKRYALMKKKIGRDYDTLRRYCREVSNEVKDILDRNRIPSKLLLIKSPTGGSHYTVEVLDDNVIIDGTINQFIPGNYKYVYD